MSRMNIELKCFQFHSIEMMGQRQQAKASLQYNRFVSMSLFVVRTWYLGTGHDSSIHYIRPLEETRRQKKISVESRDVCIKIIKGGKNIQQIISGTQIKNNPCKETCCHKKYWLI